MGAPVRPSTVPRPLANSVRPDPVGTPFGAKGPRHVRRSARASGSATVLTSQPSVALPYYGGLQPLLSCDWIVSFVARFRHLFGPSWQPLSNLLNGKSMHASYPFTYYYTISATRPNRPIIPQYYGASDSDVHRLAHRPRQITHFLVPAGDATGRACSAR